MDCSDCLERVDNCGPKTFATCIKYEGVLPPGSMLEKYCEVTVQDVIEYIIMRPSTNNEYFNGEGLELTENTFSVNFDEVMRASWRPTYEDIQGDKPENIKISVAGSVVEPDQGVIDISVASSYKYGVSKIGVEAGTVMEGNDSRVLEAYSWGDHSLEGYLKSVQHATNIEYGIVKFGLGPNDAVSGSDSRLVKGEEAYNWGNHNEAGYLTEIPWATTLVKGGIMLGSDLTQTMTPNSPSSESGRTYPVQLHGQGIAVVNVPWVKYIQGDGISIIDGVINNTSKNATHTGDVEGSETLSIVEGVVSNNKLKKVSPKTIKSNISEDIDYVEDVTISDFKKEAELGCMHYVIDTFPNNVKCFSNHQTSVFCKIQEQSQETLIIDDGLFDGQQLFINFNYFLESGSGVSLSGKIINFHPGKEEEVQSTLKDANLKELFLFWSVEKGAWMTRVFQKI